MISFSECLLLVYSKAVDFYRLILYSATLLKLLITSRKFLEEFLRPPVHNISTANVDSLASFLNFITVISFSCFIFQASTTRPVWKGSRNSGNSYLIPDFNEISSCIFSPFVIMFSVC